MPSLVFCQTLHHFRQNRILSASRQHAISFQRGQLRDSSVSQIRRMKVRREPAQNGCSHFLQPFSGGGCFLHFLHAALGNRCSDCIEELPDGVSVKELFIS